jgi:hypothetical protein
MQLNSAGDKYMIYQLVNTIPETQAENYTNPSYDNYRSILIERAAMFSLFCLCW